MSDLKEPPYSLYFHIPFCRHRCSYCDFNTYAGIENLIPEYGRALRREVKLAAEAAGQKLPVHTVFFGGGTPSLLPASQIEALLINLERYFLLSPELEFTLEANPGTLSLPYLEDLHKLGVNRLSLGMQSANPQELALLERQHQVDEVICSIKWARQAGFNNINLDLIFGLPYQSIPAWQRTLDFAIQLGPEHFSLYALTLEHGTPLQHWTSRGMVSEPDPDLAADMYELASERLSGAGYCQYEISNWASAIGGGTKTCRHNLQYWRNLPYLGFGAGAHGYAQGYRTANVLAPAVYIQRCLDGKAETFPRTPATTNLTHVDQQAEMGETMLVGLRLVQEGVSEREFKLRFGLSLSDLYGEKIQRLEKLGLLEWAGDNNDRLRLTTRGRLLGNQVFVEFI